MTRVDLTASSYRDHFRRRTVSIANSPDAPLDGRRRTGSIEAAIALHRADR